MSKLVKSKALKNKLKHNLMNIDYGKRKSIGFDKLKIEAKMLGINLSDEDFSMIPILFENHDNYDYVKNEPEIDYENMIKYINPILIRNNDTMTSQFNSKKSTISNLMSN